MTTTDLPRSATAPVTTDSVSAVAHNYAPLPVEIATGEGCWVTDTAGGRHLDLLAAYSALNFGHRHPHLVAAAHAQLDRLTLTSRAFGTDLLEPFSQRLAALCVKEAVLTMNTGAEAVETAIKIARRWGYERKGVAADEATIIVADGNFHGRTTTIIGFSTDAGARRGFGPFTPGFVTVPYGDADAAEAAMDESTVAFLVEPVQGEAGVIVPPEGYLRSVADACRDHDVLLVADEIQSGLGRTGRTFACDHEGVTPDLYVLGKALGGGVMPLSAVVGDWDVLDVITPGSHGSTFGGNPLACAIGGAVLDLLETGEPQKRAATLGHHLARSLDARIGDRVEAIRTCGLWAGIDLQVDGPDGAEVCRRLLDRRVLAKDTHGHTIRLSPPLVIDEADLDFAVEQLGAVIDEATSGTTA